jgi:hypothetical protein
MTYHPSLLDGLKCVRLGFSRSSSKNAIPTETAIGSTGTKQTAGKANPELETFPQGLKPFDFAAIAARLKPCPDTKLAPPWTSSSAAWEARNFQGSCGLAQAMP